MQFVGYHHRFRWERIALRRATTIRFGLSAAEPWLEHDSRAT